MLYESVMIGIFGSVFGTITGLIISYILQNTGIDMSAYLQKASVMIPTKFRAQVTSPAYYIGFIPGLAATVLGSALSGFGIYKRNTAQLFKELEV